MDPRERTHSPLKNQLQLLSLHIETEKDFALDACRTFLMYWKWARILALLKPLQHMLFNKVPCNSLKASRLKDSPLNLVHKVPCTFPSHIHLPAPPWGTSVQHVANTRDLCPCSESASSSFSSRWNPTHLRVPEMSAWEPFPRHYLPAEGLVLSGCSPLVSLY